MFQQELLRAGVESVRFAGQVVVVTGAAGGIGGACALRFAQEQARVACLDIDAAGAEVIAARCRDLGVEAIALACDVTDAAAVETAFAAVAARWGGIDVLVASAGVYTGAPLEEVPVALPSAARITDGTSTPPWSKKRLSSPSTAASRAYGEIWS